MAAKEITNGLFRRQKENKKNRVGRKERKKKLAAFQSFGRDEILACLLLSTFRSCIRVLRLCVVFVRMYAKKMIERERERETGVSFPTLFLSFFLLCLIRTVWYAAGERGTDWLKTEAERESGREKELELVRLLNATYVRLVRVAFFSSLILILPFLSIPPPSSSRMYIHVYMCVYGVFLQSMIFSYRIYPSGTLFRGPVFFGRSSDSFLNQSAFDGSSRSSAWCLASGGGSRRRKERPFSQSRCVRSKDGQIFVFLVSPKRRRPIKRKEAQPSYQ